MSAVEKISEHKKTHPYSVLSDIDTRQHTMKKGKFDYLPWARAVGLLLEHYPDATWYYHEYEDGYVRKAGNGWMVKTTVVIAGVPRSEVMPVINYQNKVITEPTSFEVNTALKRCLVKNIALFGLGLEIYMGEEMEEQTWQYTPEQKAEFDEAINEKDSLTIASLRHVMTTDAYIGLYNSFPKGEKGVYKQIATDLETEGSAKLNEIRDSFLELCKSEDEFGIREQWDELSTTQKGAVYRLLDKSDQIALKKLLEATAEETNG